MLRKVINFKKRFGYFGFIRLLCFPLTSMFSSVYRVMQLLWSSRILLNGKWGQYSGFNMHFGINNLFYWTQNMNLEKYGRNGVSKTMCGGDYFLGRLFHLSLFSNYMFRNWGVTSILVSLMAFLMSSLMAGVFISSGIV